MDPVVPRLEEETRRRRRRRLFRHRRVPVRMMVPNFFTILGLCAVTSIRMSIEGRWELALALIVFAALLDGVDGRVARLLKASSLRRGARRPRRLRQLRRRARVPPLHLGLGGLKGAGWICVMIFALAAGLRLARFNVAIEEDRPKWQSDFFTGMPTPAAAIVVLLPVYLDNLGFDGIRLGWGLLVLVYTLAIAFMMVSEIPTYSGKLLGERIGREFVCRSSCSRLASWRCCSPILTQR